MAGYESGQQARANASRWVAVVIVIASLLAAYLMLAGPRRSWRDGIPSLDGLSDAQVQALAERMDHNMVQVPAGVFVMGSDEGRADERPQHPVYLDGFEIDRLEVTNAQYYRFLQSSQRPPPPHWSGERYPHGQAAYPVVGVSWEDASAYCAWANKRLPSEAEWEKACRGEDARMYPWGDLWEPWRANVSVPESPAIDLPAAWDTAWRLLETTPVAGGTPGLRPAGSYPDGAGPYGVLDLVGNASEWVSDWYNWGDYSEMPDRNPQGLGPPWNRCLRGSPWYDPVGTAAWTQKMSRCSARSSSHEVRDPRVGFRCARSLP